MTGASVEAPRSSWLALEVVSVIGLLVLAALLLYAPRETADLKSDPSAYTAQSLGLLEGEGNTIRIGDEALPGFYPPAYPLAIVPVHWLLGYHPQNGVFASLGFALLALLLVYALGRRLAGPVAGAVAFLLLLGNELFGGVAHTILTQSFALCAVALTAILAVSSVASPASSRRCKCLAFSAGLVAGLSLLIRYQNFIFAGGLGLWALLSAQGSWRARLRTVAPLWTGVVLGGLVVMGYCAAAYGSPLRTGYHLWGFPFGGSFSLDHLFNPKLFEGPDRESWILVRCLTGFGPLYPFPVAVLWLVGTIVAWRRRATDPSLAAASLLTVVLNVVLFLILGLYVFRSPKYAMLGLPLIAVMASIGLVSWFRGRRIGGAPATAVPVLLASLFLIPAVQRSFLLGEGGRAKVGRGQAVIEGADVSLERDAVVLGYTDPILTNVVFVRNTERRYLYLDHRPEILTPFHEQARAEIGGAELTAESVAGYVAAHLTRGTPVYFLIPSPDNSTDAQRVLELHAFLAGKFTFERTSVPEIEVIRP